MELEVCQEVYSKIWQFLSHPKQLYGELIHAHYGCLISHISLINQISGWSSSQLFVPIKMATLGQLNCQLAHSFATKVSTVTDASGHEILCVWLQIKSVPQAVKLPVLFHPDRTTVLNTVGVGSGSSSRQNTTDLHCPYSKFHSFSHIITFQLDVYLQLISRVIKYFVLFYCCFLGGADLSSHSLHYLRNPVHRD